MQIQHYNTPGFTTRAGTPKPPGSGRPWEGVRRAVYGEPGDMTSMSEDVGTGLGSCLVSPAIIEPPVLALSEEVGPLVAPLQRPVNVPRQAPLGDALGVLVTADVRLPDIVNTSIFNPTCYE